MRIKQQHQCWPPHHQYKLKNWKFWGVFNDPYCCGLFWPCTVMKRGQHVQKTRAFCLWFLYTRINSGLLPTTSILVLRQNMRPQDFRPDYKSRWLKVLHDHVFISFIRSQAESSFLTITGDTNIPFSLILSTVCYIKGFHYRGHE